MALNMCVGGGGYIMKAFFLPCICQTLCLKHISWQSKIFIDKFLIFPVALFFISLCMWKFCYFIDFIFGSLSLFLFDFSFVLFICEFS